ncbi:unnamed protein product [Lactuca virosa]|uniref:Uncharacterized protein n=1 Tax=Lactuca virosa TaxID=75947 RepID=A0AAU9M3G5_9ASTR|nr:unnamed protein product [Lactuca virosa]
MVAFVAHDHLNQLHIYLRHSYAPPPTSAKMPNPPQLFHGLRSIPLPAFPPPIPSPSSATRSSVPSLKPSNRYQKPLLQLPGLP